MMPPRPDDKKKGLHARVDLASERARAAQQTATDIEERYTEVEAAMMRHIRRLEATTERVEEKNDALSKVLGSIQRWTPVAAALAASVASVVSSTIHAWSGGGTGMDNLDQVGSWIGRNWLVILAVWAAAGSVARIIANRTVDTFPRVHGIAVALSGLLSDTLQVFEGLGRAVKGLPSGPPDPPAPPPPPPPAKKLELAEDDDSPPTTRVNFRYGRLQFAGVMVLAGTLFGCASWWTPAHEADVAQVFECVAQGVEKHEPPEQILGECVGSTIPLIESVEKSRHKPALAAKGGAQ